MDHQSDSGVIEEVRSVCADGARLEGENGDERSTATNNNNGKKEKKDRARHKCPFPSCSANVVHLPRHMRQVHKWAKEDTVGIVNAFCLRKNRKGSENSKIKRKICPVTGCKSVVKRLHNHLTDFHGLKRGSKWYKQSLKEAVPYEVIELSSESTCESSSDEEQRLPRKKRRDEKKPKKKVKKERHETIFKKVYSSDDDDDNDGQSYPSIFKRPSGDEGECSYKLSDKSSEKLPENDEMSEKEIADDRVSQKGEMSQREQVSADQSSQELKSTDQSSSDGNYSDESGSEQEEIPFNKPLNAEPEEERNFQNFEEWLQTAEGSRKEERVALKCSRQVQLVMQYINPVKPTLKDVLNKETLKNQWLNKFEKERRPGTVKSYLGDLRQFYFFLQCTSPKNIDVSPKVLNSLVAQMTQWSKSFHKLVKNRFWEKRMIDMEKLRTPEQIRTFASSAVARTAVNMLDEYQSKPDGTMPSQSEYTTVRDYLVTSVCINNGSRSGALANMTVSEFKSAQEVDDSFVVKVRKHKTFSTHGPANLVFSTTLYNWMMIYINKFRYPIADMTCNDSEPVFLTWKNRPMAASHIGCQINSSWGKVFGKETATGGASAFRKAAVSAVHRSDKERRGELAELMVHNKATADRYYLLEEKAATAVKTSKYLTEILHAKEPNTGIKATGTPGKDVEAADTPSSLAEDSAGQRRKWMPEEEEEIKRLFAAQIEDQSITLKTVRRKISDSPVLKQISPLKIRDKIRTFFGSVPCPLPSLPEETAEERLDRSGYKAPSQKNKRKRVNKKTSEYTPSEDAPESEKVSEGEDAPQSDDASASLISPSTCVSRKSTQKLFGDDVVRDFCELFKDLICSNKSITKALVKERLEGAPKLRHLLEKCTLLQLADKVRTERKRHAARK